MLGGEVEFAPEAEHELDELYFRIRVDIGPNAADTFAQRVRRALRNLADFPLMGRSRDEFPGMPRSLSIHPGVIFYEPMKNKRGIKVLRILDGRRDLGALLGQVDQ